VLGSSLSDEHEPDIGACWGIGRAWDGLGYKHPAQVLTCLCFPCNLRQMAALHHHMYPPGFQVHAGGGGDQKEEEEVLQATQDLNPYLVRVSFRLVFMIWLTPTLIVLTKQSIIPLYATDPPSSAAWRPFAPFHPDT
jgi:hypothetical protein